MEANPLFSTSIRSKLKFQKNDMKETKRRPVLVSIDENSRLSQQLRKQPGIKRSISIANLARRLSITSMNKKAEEVIASLSKMPKKDKHLMTAQIKCFMMAKHTHDSHLMEEKLTITAIQKMRNSDRFLMPYNFKTNKFILFCENVLKKSADSSVLISSYEQCMTEKYPPSINLMLIYLGAFFYSINSQYEAAEACCQKLLDIIVKFKLQEFFIIYLVLKIKLKTNLSQWEDTLKLLTKLVFFSWMYNLTDLEIWCYFELSRAYFFLQMSRESEIFRLKSQANTIEPKRSIYREVSVSNLILQIQAIWEGQIDFKFNTVIEQTRLVIPESNKYSIDQYISDQRKLKTNIKGIIQDCKIRHVNNLLARIGEIGMHSIQKQNLNQSNSSLSVNCSPNHEFLQKYNPSPNQSQSSNVFAGFSHAKSGNNFLLTHKSFNKNMCMFFRRRATQQKSQQRTFYTIENSQKNWGVLIEMLKNIYIEMVYFASS